MERAVQILNRLLQAEHASLIGRLAECDPFVSGSAVLDLGEIRRMEQDVRRHQQDLVQRILAMRGAPVSPTYSTATGGDHFLRLSFLIPQVVANTREMVGLYEAAGTTGDRDADLLLARHLEDHRRHLAALERLHANVAPATAR